MFGFGKQTVTLGLDNPMDIIEKKTVKLEKEKIDLIVKKGAVAYVSGTSYKGSPNANEIDAAMMGGRKGDEVTVYVAPDKTFDTVVVNFFAGSHAIGLSARPDVKANFSIVGSAEVMINDYELLAQHYDKNMTRDDLVNDINESYRQILGNEINEAASKYISLDTTENTLKAKLSDIVKDVFKGGRKCASVLAKIGLVIMPSSVSLTVNPLGDADEMTAKILDQINQKAFDSFDEEKKQKEYEREQAEIQAQRQYEIDMEKAKHTNVNEQKTDTKISQDGSASNISIVNNQSQPTEKYCVHCGAKISASAVFCSNCGKKQE